MATLRQTAEEFLSCKRIAVAGLSSGTPNAANGIYRRLRDAGYQVFAVNPNADQVEDDACYPDLGSIPGGAEAVVVGTHPSVSADVVRQAAEAGVSRVWIHRGIGPGSYSEEAVRAARDAGLTVIPGGCPMMFLDDADVFHRCLGWLQRTTGKLPKTV